MVLSSRSANWSTMSTTGVYALSLVVALAFSAAYNMWPVSRTKWMLRRCDQAAIFLLIGGTYTAFLTQAPDDAATFFAMAAIWTAAFLGNASIAGSAGRVRAAFDRRLPHSRLERPVLCSVCDRGHAGDGTLSDRAGRLPLLGRRDIPPMGTPTVSECSPHG